MLIRTYRCIHVETWSHSRLVACSITWIHLQLCLFRSIWSVGTSSRIHGWVYVRLSSLSPCWLLRMSNWYHPLLCFCSSIRCHFPLCCGRSIRSHSPLRLCRSVWCHSLLCLCRSIWWHCLVCLCRIIWCQSMLCLCRNIWCKCVMSVCRSIWGQSLLCFVSIYSHFLFWFCSYI